MGQITVYVITSATVVLNQKIQNAYVLSVRSDQSKLREGRKNSLLHGHWSDIQVVYMQHNMHNGRYLIFLKT